MDEQKTNTAYLLAPSKVTLEFELLRIFPCLTPMVVPGFSEVLTKQAIKWRSTCRVIPIRSSVLISLLLSSGFWSFASAILRKTNENLPWWLRIVDTSSHR